MNLADNAVLAAKEPVGWKKYFTELSMDMDICMISILLVDVARKLREIPFVR